MSRQIAERVSSYFQGLLDKEGYNRGEIRWDDNAQTSDLIFKVEGRSYLLIADADDTDFVRLVFPNFWPLESDEEFAAALQAISIVNARCKGAKIHATSKNDNMAVSVEFLVDPDNLHTTAKHFLRYVGMLNHAAQTFAETMREFTQNG